MGVVHDIVLERCVLVRPLSPLPTPLFLVFKQLDRWQRLTRWPAVHCRTARYYCVLMNVGGILCVLLLFVDSTAPYAESIIGINYATVWRKHLARDPGYDEIDQVDQEYASYGD